MTIITFANVVARYVFNDNILWALESDCLSLFAWLVLLGASYCVKKTTAHLGVDVVVNMVSPPATRRRSWRCYLVACLPVIFSAAAAQRHHGITGYLFATERARRGAQRPGLNEVNDIPMPAFLQLHRRLPINEGEAYEKLPRFIPYAALPIGLALLTVPFPAGRLAHRQGRDRT